MIYFAHVKSADGGWKQTVVEFDSWFDARDHLTEKYGEGNYWGVRELGKSTNNGDEK